jgi:hypothetical protein
VYFIEVTDTFGGEANYSWVKRYLVDAATPRGALRKVTRLTGDRVTLDSDYGSMMTYRVPQACIVYFITQADGSEATNYCGLMEL